MPLFRNSVIAEPSAVDDTLVRWDTTTGQDVNGVSPASLTDAGLLTLATTSSQIVVAGTASTFVVSGVTLSPHIVAHTDSATAPNVAWARDSTSASGAPGHNFFRARAAGAVQNADQLVTVSGIGHDGTDYATGGTMDLVVDEADSGTSAVAANSMGSQWRFLNSRRGGQSPGVSVRIRHNGALQMNTAITLMATPSAGCLEADTKVLYYTPEDLKRGLCLTEYVIRLDSANTLASSIARQPLFDSVGAGAVALPAGAYCFEGMVSLASMSGSSGNCKFAIKGDGTATVGDYCWISLANEQAVGVVANVIMGLHTTDETPEPVATAATATTLQCFMKGSFAVTGAGTLIPAVELTTGVSTAQVAIGSHMRFWPLGADNMQTVGPWS